MTLHLVVGTNGRGVWTAPAGEQVRTSVAPGASSSGSTSVAVATGTDGRIYYNWWLLGQGGAGWRELDGDGRTDAALVGPGNDYLFVAVKGLDGNVYLNQGQLGHPFVGWQPIGD